MKPVEDDLVVGVDEMSSHRVGVGLPHVHGHRLDARQLLIGETLEIAVQAGRAALVGDVLDRVLVEVTHHGDVVLAPAG